MEGWLKKKSPKTQGKKVLDLWQRRYFVLSAGELSYYKTEKAAKSSSAESLKSIRLAEVRSASVNPRHADMFVLDLGHDKKVKLQAADERERDKWVAALEAAKVRAWSQQAQQEHDQIAAEARRLSPTNVGSCSSASSSGGSGGSRGGSSSKPIGSQGRASPAGSAARRSNGSEPDSPASSQQIELLRFTPQRKQGCCVIS